MAQLIYGARNKWDSEPVIQSKNWSISPADCETRALEIKNIIVLKQAIPCLQQTLRKKGISRILSEKLEQIIKLV